MTEFEKYLKEARQEFCKEVNKYNVSDNLQLRTACDSFMIAFDQATMYNKERVKRIVSEWFEFKAGIILSNETLSKLVDDITETKLLKNETEIEDFKEQLRVANVVQRTWLFCGGHGKKYFEIEVSAEDRESAIAYFETDYSELKWVMTKEL